MKIEGERGQAANDTCEKSCNVRAERKAGMANNRLLLDPWLHTIICKQNKQKVNIMANFEGNGLDDPRAFERFLRDQGYSRARAKAITAKGFETSSHRHDSQTYMPLIADLKNKESLLEEMMV